MDPETSLYSAPVSGMVDTPESLGDITNFSRFILEVVVGLP